MYQTWSYHLCFITRFPGDPEVPSYPVFYFYMEFWKKKLLETTSTGYYYRLHALPVIQPLE